MMRFVSKNLFSIQPNPSQCDIIEEKEVDEQMRKRYPSDISRKQFEEIREDLAGAKRVTHPRKYDLYGGYTGETFANTVKALSGAEVEVVKRSELHTFAALPKRWIVERSFAWLDKCRRLW